MNPIRDHHIKDRTRVIELVAKASELQDLLSSHQRSNGKGVHMSVGNISKIEGHLGGTCTCFQCLLDHTVAPKGEKSTNLLYFMGINFDCFTVSIGSQPISMTKNRSNPKQNGVKTPTSSF